jgi:hypothetical protein
MAAARVKAVRSKRSVATVLDRHKDFCLELINLARQRNVPWDVRRLAMLTAEQQILRLHADDLEGFDALFVALNLKQPGLDRRVTSAVLKEGYTTTELRGFIVEFQRKLSKDAPQRDRCRRSAGVHRTLAPRLQTHSRSLPLHTR